MAPTPDVGYVRGFVEDIATKDKRGLPVTREERARYEMLVSEFWESVLTFRIQQLVLLYYHVDPKAQPIRVKRK